jgi:tetratricopeptide (TPR) repeat protein
MGEGYIKSSQHREAREAYETTLERARNDHSPETVLSAYIGMIKLQQLRLDATFDDHFVHAVMALAQHVPGLALHAQLHQALGAAYVHFGETHKALGHGQTAYGLWHRLANNVEMARTSIVLADACRIAQRPNQAERFLRLASSLFARTDYAPSYCLTAYEEGILYLQSGDHEAARQWLTIALEEARVLDRPHYVAMSQHSLAIAQIELHMFLEAETNLHDALAMWERLENWFNQANIYQALGYLEGQRGNTLQAHRWLQQALELCPRIPETPFRDMIETLIQETIDEIK